MRMGKPAGSGSADGFGDLAEVIFGDRREPVFHVEPEALRQTVGMDEAALPWPVCLALNGVDAERHAEGEKVEKRVTVLL